jgi:hypothetical protein
VPRGGVINHTAAKWRRPAFSRSVSETFGQEERHSMPEFVA